MSLKKKLRVCLILDACKKVNRKINGRKLSNVSNKEMDEILKISVSS